MTHKQKRLLALVAENVAMLLKSTGRTQDHDDLVNAIGEFESEIEDTIQP